MKISFLFLRVCLLLPLLVSDKHYHAQAQQDSDVVTVRTSLGDIQGTTNNKGVDSFLGIQYAVVGKRFSRSTSLVVEEDPVVVNRQNAFTPASTSLLEEEPHQDGTINATQYGPVCWQDSPLPLDMDEECLYLNVWRPSKKIGTTIEEKNAGTTSINEETSSSSSLATLVYIHGGDHLTGSGQDFTGKVLASKYNIIVVTFNYRLGPLGSLVMDESGRGGMNSVHDAFNALIWVQQYIASFGGDPNQITLAGSGAGAMMASILSVSPLAQGLFQQVILQSGFSTLGIRPRNPLEGWELTRSTLDYYGVESVRDLANATQFPASEMHAWSDESNPQPWPWHLQFLTIDGHVLLQQPQDLYMAAAAGHAIPIQPIKMMVSTTSYDGLVPFRPYKWSTPTQVNIAEFQHKLVENFGREQGVKLYQEYDPALPPFGWGNQYEHSAFAALTMLDSDLGWTCPARELAATAAQALRAKGGNVYLYNFAHHTPHDTAFNDIVATPPDVNATGWMSHGVDQSFLQGYPAHSLVNGTWTKLDETISHHFLSYVIRFIRTGDPNTRSVATNAAEWLPVDAAMASTTTNTGDVAIGAAAADVNTMVFASTSGGGVEEEEARGNQYYSYLHQSGTNQRKTELCSLLLQFLYDESWRYNHKTSAGKEEEEAGGLLSLFSLDDLDSVTMVGKSAAAAAAAENSKEEAMINPSSGGNSLDAKKLWIATIGSATASFVVSTFWVVGF